MPASASLLASTLAIRSASLDLLQDRHHALAADQPAILAPGRRAVVLPDRGVGTVETVLKEQRLRVAFEGLGRRARVDHRAQFKASPADRIEVEGRYGTSRSRSITRGPVQL